MATKDAVLLAGHGSRRNESNRQVRDVAERLESRLGDPVKPAFIELEEPLLHDGIDALAETADSITVVPLTLFAAGHVKNDIPLVVHHAREQHPSVTLDYGSHLGVRPEMVDIVADRIEAIESTMAVDPTADDVAVVFCARGSSDPDANAEACRLARFVYEGRDFTRVEPTFIGITEPLLDRTLSELAAHDPDGIVVVPYMLGDGVLTRRVEEMVASFDEDHPGIEAATADVLGIDDRLIDVLEDRVQEARRGEVSMSCDTCKYKVTLDGFEDEVGGEQAFVDSLEHTLAHVRGGHDHDHSHGDHEHGHSEADHDHSHGDHGHGPSDEQGHCHGHDHAHSDDEHGHSHGDDHSH